MFVVKRSDHNPILIPKRDHHWEAFATFNMSVVRKGKKLYGLYRAITGPDVLRNPDKISVIGLSESTDGEHFEGRREFIAPEKEWEKFGCEDPRVTFFEGKYYIFYTALSVYPFAPEGIKVAVAISSDLDQVDERHPVTTFNAKAMTLFPERVDGKATVIFSAHTDGSAAKMVIAQADDVSDFWSPDFWEEWHKNLDDHAINLRRSDNDQVEVGAVPIKTEQGWLLIYSHIENYFSQPDGLPPRFGIEAVLLDLDNPKKIIGRTKGPILVPEEPYELSGYVQNIIFPTGADVDGSTLTIYYGAADTTVASAKVDIDDLISSINPDTMERWHFQRAIGNPVMEAIPEHDWEGQAVFNPAAIDLDGKVHILYRALSPDNTASVGYAASEDGLTITERSPEPIYVPKEDFENKKIDGGNSGCEDPRLTKIGKNIYMCYTAFDGIGPPRVAITSISESDFLAKKWQKWKKPELITPAGVDDKDTCLLSEKIGDKYLVLHRIGTDICGDYIDSLNFKKEKIDKCIRVLGPRRGAWDSAKVGITAPPIKTSKGWLLLYHAVSERHHTYRVGAVLLDPKDPTIVLARSADPIFEPEEKYEKEGIVNNVVFPCGAVVRDGVVYIYYGGADKVIGIATMKLEIILNSLTSVKRF
jgi:beta-1,2-mannobiose phosphorylase / 1,2-beta-oligomannan phosphorylase